MNEKKKYILRAETGHFLMEGNDVRFILQKIRKYTEYSKKWLIVLIIIIIFQILLTLWREANLTFRAINIILNFASLYFGYKAVIGVKEIEKVIK